MEVSMVNAYIMYRWFHELKKLPMMYDYYGFQEAIGIAFIEPRLG